MRVIQDQGILTIRKPRGDKHASILVAGDCCPRATGEEFILQGKSEEILADLQDIFSAADLSLIQFETPLTTADTPIVKSGPNLKCHPDVIDFLHAWGGDVALLANNHIGDFGTEPVLETIATLEANGFKTVGAGANLDEAIQPLIVEANGLSIGILNIAENEFGGAGPNKPGAAPLSPCFNISQILQLAPQVDCCIVITHGGNEYNPIPSPRVVNMSRAFADAGADIVVNIHTHCLQGVENWNGSAIAYCPGNFYFPWPKDRPYAPADFWLIGALLRFDIDEEGVCGLQLFPTVFTADGSSIRQLTGKQRDGFNAYMKKISEPLKDWSKIIAFHECWAANSSYAKTLINAAWTPADFDAPAPNKKLMPLRNLLTCEAHHEVLSTYMRLVEEGRLESARECAPQLKELSEASFME